MRPLRDPGRSGWVRFLLLLKFGNCGNLWKWIGCLRLRLTWQQATSSLLNYRCFFLNWWHLGWSWTKSVFGHREANNNRHFCFCLTLFQQFLGQTDSAFQKKVINFPTSDISNFDFEHHRSQMKLKTLLKHP